MAWTVGSHAAGLRKALVSYKYRDQRWWGAVLGRLVAGWLEGHATWVEEYDLLVPTPAFTGPGARRTWDPVGEVTSAAVDLLDGQWELAADAVIKTAETPPMTRRTGWERRALAEGALRAALAVPDPDRVAGARIIVVDDVLTEGSTLNAVAACLRRAGAAEVAGLALIRASWAAHRPPPTVAACPGG